MLVVCKMKMLNGPITRNGPKKFALEPDIYVQIFFLVVDVPYA